MKALKIFSLLGLTALSITGCSPEDDIQTPSFQPLVLGEDFHRASDHQLLPKGWTTFTEAGTVKWKQAEHSGDRYAEYTAYQSSDVTSIAWMISPPINMDAQQGETLVFQSAQAYVDSYANSLEVLVSTDFDGTNVATATWELKPFTLPTLGFDYNFDWFNSGAIDLSGYTGTLYIAFKAKGSGTNIALDGTFQIDNVEIYTK